MKKFIIQRFKKDGTEVASFKVNNGVWVEPHSQEEFDKNTIQNKINKENGIKERFIYYPGTKIPHIHYMEIKKKDSNSYIGGAPPPWTISTTITVNQELLNTENLYEKLEKAKKENDQEQIKFLTRPLVSWTCPSTGLRKSLYAQSVTISNRNDKSDFVYENLERFEKSIKKIEEIYLNERINSKRGVSALINLLSSKMAFRVGNQTDKKNTGIGVTTFRNENVYFDEKATIHFKFKGKKGVSWHKKLTPKTEIEKCIHYDLVVLKDKNKDFLFMYKDERVNSGDVNELFREVFEVKKEELEYLSFHSWRHFLASVNFLKHIKKLNLEKQFKKIDEKQDINMNLKKARLLNKEVNQIFKDVAPILNDTPGVVKSTYSGGKIFKELYDKNGIEFDEKKRSWCKDSYSHEIEAEKQRREQRKLEKSK
jgi:DNA topoisomerase IB